MQKRKIGMYAAAIICLLCIVGIAGHFWQQYKAQKLYDDLALIVQNPVPNVSADIPSAESVQNGSSILPEFAALYRRNPHMIGWIFVPDTQINYPVVQTPDAPDYYLHRSFDGSYSEGGCLYLQEDCSVNTSDNLIIHGHNMRNGSMFGELHRYADQSFWQDHRVISFNSLTENGTYEILAAFVTSVTADDAFRYWDFTHTANEKVFDGFVEHCKAMSLYDTGVTAAYGDKLITLSTCDYTVRNGRFVVVAKKIKEVQ